MKLYDELGFVIIDNVLRQGAVFNLLVGGRGTGKTYGALTHAIDKNLKMLYIRRTQAQVDILRTPEFSPFNAINNLRGTNYTMFPLTKYNSVIAPADIDEEGKQRISGDAVGYICALSTFSNLRGFDMSDVELIIFDEFIPERHDRPIKNEAEAFFNAYETINRNRELQGKPPARVLCLANSNQLTAPLLLYLKVARKLEKMQERGQTVSVDEKRSLAIFNLCDSPISAKKRNTALYKLTSGTSFERMSVDNRFMRETGANIKSRPIVEYKPVVAVGEICVYVHKSNPTLYVSAHISGDPAYYDATEKELIKMRRTYSYLWAAYMSGQVEFEDYFCEVLFCEYFKFRG